MSVVDIVQRAATLNASELSDPIELAMRGANEFSLVFRLLREREGGLEYHSGVPVRAQIRLALLEALMCASKLDEALG